MLKSLRGLFASPRDEQCDAPAKPPEEITLAKALERGWLELWYQAKVSFQNTAQVVGAEGLIRLRHPERGVLGPGAFLPGASDDDMLAMTERVIAVALRDWDDVAAYGMGALQLAVNVPASAFVKLPIVRMISEGRPRAQEWPGLILEVTEDQVVNDLDMANDVAHELREMSCGLAIDDFGAGYSSLARLRQLPFTELKIDRAYVANCDSDRMMAGVLESIVELARRFDLKSVAEGVETPRESHKLQGIGCNVGQGFLFAKTMPKDEFLTRFGRKVSAPKVEPPRPWWRFGAEPKLKTAR